MSRPGSPPRAECRTAFAAALAVALACPALAGGSIEGAARAIDGDTLVIGEQRIRVAAIDAPERTQLCRRDGKDWPCGKLAGDALAALVAGKTVVCVDTGQRSYRRVVATCAVDGQDVGAAMVGQGWAREIRRYSKGRYTAAEKEAKQQLKGAWAGGIAGFEDPAAFRKGH